MFSLMDRVPDGITPMLQDLEDHIASQGLDDMKSSAEQITTVSCWGESRASNGSAAQHDRLLSILLNVDNGYSKIEALILDCEWLVLSWFFSLVLFQDSEQYVEKLLELFNRFSVLVKDAFVDDPRFLTSRDKVSAAPSTGIFLERTCFW